MPAVREKKPHNLYLQHPDLPQCNLPNDGIVLRLHKLLDGDDLPRVSVPALEDHAVGALPDLPNLLVLLHIHTGMKEKQIRKITFIPSKDLVPMYEDRRAGKDILSTRWVKKKRSL